MSADPLIFSTRTLRVTLGALLAGLAISATVAWQDARARTQLEHICLPSALGVDQFVTLPEPLEFQSELARFGGDPVFAASLSIRDLPEGELEVLTSENPGDPPVFRRYQPARERHAVKKEQEYFLKVGPGAYIRVHQGPDKAPFATGKVGCVMRER